MYREKSFAERAGLTTHRSLFRERLQGLARSCPLVDWLVQEANLRGYFGATGPEVPERPRANALSDEQLIVALLMPHGCLDVRLFKLVLRILQQGDLDPSVLWLEARKERAESTLYWLLGRVPGEELTPGVEAVMAAQPHPPRGYRPLPIDYDPRRLLRRVATRESTWRAARR
jgi:hypothetical protein